MHSTLLRRTTLALAALLALTAPVVAHAASTPAVPIPSDPRDPVVQPFTGSAAEPQPYAAQSIPRNPYMAANERSNIHNDAYQTDAYNVPRSARSRPEGHQHDVRRRVCLGDVRPQGTDRDGLRLPHRRHAADARSEDAGDPRVVRAAATRARHVLVQQLLRRRLLLPRRPRPRCRRHLHRAPAGDRRGRRERRGLQAGARHRRERGDRRLGNPERTARLGRTDLVRDGRPASSGT